jgi:uncharacterized membrane protein/osmotically-inducible protein OsmY
MATNEKLEHAVRVALDSDKRLAHPEEVAVIADDDAVTLRGTVGTFSQRRAAVRAARKIAGVDYVLDELNVELLDAADRSDAELRGMALQAIAWDTEVPAESIDVEVTSGVVTLKGEVTYQFQSDAAYEDVANLFGVIGMTNEINVIDPTTSVASVSSEDEADDGPTIGDDPLTRENVIAVTFDEEASAYEGLARLKELDAQDHIDLVAGAVVTREPDGQIAIKAQYGEESMTGTAGGGLIGLLVGILGGPLGVIVGGATGLVVGSLFDMDDDDETESVLGDISKSIRVGPPALLAEVSEDSTAAIDAAMAHLRGNVLRRSVDDVEAEIAAAEHAQREAKRQARKDLFDARRKQQKADVDAKVAALKAKLPGHKHLATAGS